MTQKITGGSYDTTSDGNIQVSLQLGPSEIETLTGTLASPGQGFVATINGSPGSGTLDLQTSTAAPSGGYALSLYGGDAVWLTPRGSQASSTSTVQAASPVPAASWMQSTATASYGGTHTVGASTVSAPDAYGRVLFQVRPGSGSTLPAIYLAGYIVDATHIRLIETNDNLDNTNFQWSYGRHGAGAGR